MQKQSAGQARGVRKKSPFLQSLAHLVPVDACACMLCESESFGLRAAKRLPFVAWLHVYMNQTSWYCSCKAWPVAACFVGASQATSRKQPNAPYVSETPILLSVKDIRKCNKLVNL
jgi:hypothetical protein